MRIFKGYRYEPEYEQDFYFNRPYNPTTKYLMLKAFIDKLFGRKSPSICMYTDYEYAYDYLKAVRKQGRKHNV